MKNSIKNFVEQEDEFSSDSSLVGSAEASPHSSSAHSNDDVAHLAAETKPRMSLLKKLTSDPAPIDYSVQSSPRIV